MNAAVATGLFALGGVLVGGFITYVMERRREGWIAKKDARLFIPHLRHLRVTTDEALENGWPWQDLCRAAEEDIPHWEVRYAEVFAGTLTPGQWTTVYSAVRNFQEMTRTARRDGTRITEGDRQKLQAMSSR